MKIKNNRPTLAGSLKKKIPINTVQMCIRDSYILFDNRTCIQLCRYVMACCTNNLHTSLEGGVIWFRTDERLSLIHI